MTWKNAAAGLPLGGGTAVIMDASAEPADALVDAFAGAVEELGGRYVAAEDIGTSSAHMDRLSRTTKCVAGRSLEAGGSGDPSPATTRNVFAAIQAAARGRWRVDDLRDLKVGVLGVGKVGRALASRAAADGADLVVADIDLDRARSVATSHPGARVLSPDALVRETRDILAPCATGGLLAPGVSGSLGCQVICGAANNMWTVRSIVRHYRLGRDDVFQCLMPLFHVHGLVASVWRRWPPVAGSSCRCGRARAASSVDSATSALHGSRHPRRSSRGCSIAPARGRRLPPCASSAPTAPPLHAQLEQRLEETHGVPVLQAYGMPEASHQISSNPHPPDPRVRGTVGVPTGIDVSIVDDGGEPPPPPGQSGHVLVTGPGVTPGYLNAVEANCEAFVDGWFRTGDLGVLESNGYLRLTGRAKEIILRGGENISPYEIDAALLEHPAVVDAVCFAIPDEKYGEEVGAAVRTDAGRGARAARVLPRPVGAVQGAEGDPRRRRDAANGDGEAPATPDAHIAP